MTRVSLARRSPSAISSTPTSSCPAPTTASFGRPTWWLVRLDRPRRPAPARSRHDSRQARPPLAERRRGFGPRLRQKKPTRTRSCSGPVCRTAIRPARSEWVAWPVKRGSVRLLAGLKQPVLAHGPPPSCLLFWNKIVNCGWILDEHGDPLEIL